MELISSFALQCIQLWVSLCVNHSAPRLAVKSQGCAVSWNARDTPACRTSSVTQFTVGPGRLPSSLPGWLGAAASCYFPALPEHHAVYFRPGRRPKVKIQSVAATESVLLCTTPLQGTKFLRTIHFKAETKSIPIKHRAQTTYYKPKGTGVPQR